MTFEELLALSGAWAWANYGKEMVAAIGKKLAKYSGDKAQEVAKIGWERLEWEVAARHYRDKVQALYGTVRILGKATPVPLEGIFTDVLILDKPTAFNRFDINQLRADPRSVDRAHKRVNGLSLVQLDESKRLFILGKPGAGKTTFLKYLTLQATNGVVDKIPIFISLKGWADSELELMPFLCKQFDICDFPDAQPFVEHILEKGDALVMFDGLDEVTQEGHQRESLINGVRDFSNQYSNIKCLITCRIAATQHEFEQFTYVELADFTDQQIQSFASKWFAGEPKKLKLFKTEFGRPENKGLRELAKIPLLLSLLCLSFDETMTFPQRRVEIYEEAIDALLKKWDGSRSIKRDEIYKGLSLGRKRQMLARVATQSFQMNEYFIPQPKLEKYITAYLCRLPGAETEDNIDGEAVLKAIEAQHGILVERAQHIYSFSHLSLQEYFTARYICEHSSSNVLRELLNANHIFDPRWREVFLQTASMLENADEFFKIFQRHLNDMVAREPVPLNVHEPALSNIANALNKVAKNKTIDKTTAIGLLYTCATLKARDLDFYVYKKHHSDSFIQETSASVCKVLGVQFPFPIIVIAVIGSEHRITNLDHVLSLIGPIISSAFDADDILDINLIYALLATAWIKAEVSTEDGTIIHLEFLKFVDSILRSIIGADDELMDQWKSLKEYPDSVSWDSVRSYLMKVILKYRSRARKWYVAETQLTDLGNYLNANNLLLECLQLAVVTDRKAIEDNFYRMR